MDKIIDNDDVLELAISNNAEILDVEAVVSFHTILAMQDSMDCFLLLVEVSDDRLCIVLGGGSVDVDVVNFCHFVEELEAVGPDVELELIAFEVEDDVCFFSCEDRVDESLV